MAQHYGTVIIPARVKKPRDKSKVETGVQIAERHILAALRDQRFFGVPELNAAMAPLTAALIDRLTEASHLFNMKECVTLGTKMSAES